MKASFLLILLIAATVACPAQNKKRMNYPQVSESLEKIDAAIVADEQSSKTVRMPDGSEMRYTKNNAGYSLRILDPRMPYAVVKNYYPNGFIKEKGVSVSGNACPLGTWYFFSESRSLDHKTDYDAGYRFDMNDVLKFLTQKRIPLPPNMPPANGKYTEIYKGKDGNTPVYYIHWLSKPELVEILTLSGANGAVLNKSYEKYSNS